MTSSENRFATTKIIKSQLKGDNARASELRKLEDWNCKVCRTARNPNLTAAMKEKHLKWAKQLCNKDVDFERSVI